MGLVFHIYLFDTCEYLINQSIVTGLSYTIEHMLNSTGLVVEYMVSPSLHVSEFRHYKKNKCMVKFHTSLRYSDRPQVLYMTKLYG